MDILFANEFSVFVLKSRKLIIFLALMMVMGVSHATQVYKWIDPQGNVHFSDMPREGAEVITIPDSQNKSSSAPPSSKPLSEPIDNHSVKLKHTYKEIAITQPVNGSTIRNNQGFVAVTVEVEPDLFPDDKLQIIYDGGVLGEPQRNRVFEINGMYRGSHTLKVQVIDAEENVIGTSDPVTIYVFRPRVGMVHGG